jgi:hypothetical protein
MAIGLLCLITLGTAWHLRAEYLLRASSGLGYGLGVAGLSMMLLMLLYSARKRVRVLRHAGAIRRWFHLHMMLGLLGPTAILLHSNFSGGSRNATIALASMLLVAGSGIVGRFIYTKIHDEYRGQKATVEQLRERALKERGTIGEIAGGDSALVALLESFERKLLVASPSYLLGLWRFAYAGWLARFTRRKARRMLRDGAGRRAEKGAFTVTDQRTAMRNVSEYIWSVRRAARFAGYDRMFSAWHVLHLPFCVLLFGSALFHVIAVHMY